ncbi:MAG: redox-sensing transcriptional repressor Rex, partial [Synergistaceae bacterium]|nr:redox-sensing transcriptional repressor Rex [Synergistaceae bacterium]
MKVAEPTVERLVLYHRLLESLRAEGRLVVSSQQMGDMLSFKASQVRKDLSYFGEIGRRGVGYDVVKLSGHIAEILSSPGVWRIALAGIGNLGAALLSSAAFHGPKVSFEALFDVDPAKVGGEIEGVKCWHYSEMPGVMRERRIEILILAVPADAAQTCVDLASSSGVLRGVLSFTRGSFTVPQGVLL